MTLKQCQDSGLEFFFFAIAMSKLWTPTSKLFEEAMVEPHPSSTMVLGADQAQSIITGIGCVPRVSDQHPDLVAWGHAIEGSWP